MAAVESAWTAERVLAMAPDPASAQAGQRLASPWMWSLLEARTSAVVGVDRKPPPTSSINHPVGPVVAELQTRPAPARLLAIAAAAWLSARAGRNPRVAPSFSPDQAPSTEDRSECSPEAARQLRSLLDDQLGQGPNRATWLAFEWFECCDQAGRRLPADLLSTLGKTAEGESLVTPILGNRGR